MTLVLLLLLVSLSSLAGLAVCRPLPWTDEGRLAGLDVILGVSLGPFLAGIAAVLALGFLPGSSHLAHGLAVFAMLGATAALGIRGRGLRWLKISSLPAGVSRLAWLALLAYVAAMVFDSAVVPLIQNDALEYATVGRILYEARTLAAYPAIDPAASASGFFGPWTHPPVYVSLIYLANVLQGQAESALAMRLIGPWCLLAATAVVAVLGGRRSHGAGLVSAVLFISSPMLFLGASSALIDPLPVLGMSIAFAALVGLNLHTRRGAAALGMLLGGALWSHSQAILFPCLLLPMLLWLSADEAPSTLHRVLRASTQALMALAVAVVVGGAPYLRNVLIFGSPISDNPEVFAFAPLQFADYFRLQRGIADPVEIIQYGVLKGFFAIEAYSLAFWLALAGVPAAARLLWSGWSRGLGGQSLASKTMAAALAVWSLYLVATVVSSALGIDLMIRNERYLLVLMPCVSLLAGMGLQSTGDSAGWRRWVVLGLLALVPAQLVALLSYRQSQLVGAMVAWDESAQVRRWPPFTVIDYLRSNTKTDSVVFTMKPADMFYAYRRMLSYLDPRTIELYKLADNLPASAAWLGRNAVTHLHLPDYLLPPAYMSSTMAMAADPQWSDLVADAQGYQVYALRSQPGRAAIRTVALSIAPAWDLQTHLVLGGRKTRMRFVVDRRPVGLSNESVNQGFLGVFHRESARVWMSAPIALVAAGQSCGGDTPELRLEVGYRGRAHAQLLAIFLDTEGRTVERRVVGDRPTLGADRLTNIVRRMRLPAGASSVQLMFEHRGVSHARLELARAEMLCTSLAAQ